MDGEGESTFFRPASDMRISAIRLTSSSELALSSEVARPLTEFPLATSFAN